MLYYSTAFRDTGLRLPTTASQTPNHEKPWWATSTQHSASSKMDCWPEDREACFWFPVLETKQFNGTGFATGCDGCQSGWLWERDGSPCWSVRADCFSNVGKPEGAQRIGNHMLTHQGVKNPTNTAGWQLDLWPRLGARRVWVEKEQKWVRQRWLMYCPIWLTEGRLSVTKSVRWVSLMASGVKPANVYSSPGAQQDHVILRSSQYWGEKVIAVI